jgi:hypothetical protein
VGKLLASFYYEAKDEVDEERERARRESMLAIL